MSPLFAQLATATADAGVKVVVDGSGSSTVKIFLLLTLLSFAPAVLVSLTSFTRIVVVLSFLRQALGTPQLPPNPVIIGLALFLTFFVMTPTLEGVYGKAIRPYLDDEIGHEEAIEAGSEVLRAFMLEHTREEDLVLFYGISGRERPHRGEALPMSVVIPAFMVSELTTAFRMALFIFIPLVLIDLMVAALLMSMGMVMVPPVMISLPLKVGVFLVADGWHLVVASLAGSYG